MNTFNRTAVIATMCPLRDPVVRIVEDAWKTQIRDGSGKGVWP